MNSLIVERFFSPPSQVLVARKLNFAIAAFPFTASIVSNSAVTLTPFVILAWVLAAVAAVMVLSFCVDWSVGESGFECGEPASKTPAKSSFASFSLPGSGV